MKMHVNEPDSAEGPAYMPYTHVSLDDLGYGIVAKPSWPAGMSEYVVTLGASGVRARVVRFAGRFCSASSAMN